VKHLPLDLLTGLLAGLALGLLVAWVISPVQYVDTTPATLRADFKDQYRLLIAQAYLASGDLGRAQARLDLLADASPDQALTAQAQRLLAVDSPPEAVHALALLALHLQQDSPPVVEAGLSPAETFTAISTTPSPPASPTPAGIPAAPTPAAPPPSPTVVTPAETSFTLLSREVVCSMDLPQALLQVHIRDSAGRPVPGVELHITWAGGEESFFTGFKPELGDGYADFRMAPGVSYTLLPGRSGIPAADLIAPVCPVEDGDPYWGSLSLVFQQP
jgi:hypothetical protein